MAQEKFYKLRHIPSGLYFKPSGANWNKNNLSETGKTYTKKPNLSFCCGEVYTGQQILSKNKTPLGFDMTEDEVIAVKPEEWEIVEFVVVESKTYSCVKSATK